MSSGVVVDHDQAETPLLPNGAVGFNRDLEHRQRLCVVDHEVGGFDPTMLMASAKRPQSRSRSFLVEICRSSTLP